MKNTELKYFIYTRRSIEQGDREERVESIESQNYELNKIVEREKLNIVGTYTETKSAKKPNNRPEFNKMVEQIKKGKANAILCFKIDRLSRNALEYGMLQQMLEDKVLLNIKSTDRSFFPDDNILMWAVEFGQAAQSSKDLAKHVKRGLDGAARNGYRPCAAPLGYKNSKLRESGKESILVDEKNFPIIREFFDLILTGIYSVSKAYEIIMEKYDLRNIRGKRYRKANFHKMLVNTFYYGWFEFPAGSGNWYPGNHKSMITKQEYDKIQIITGNRSVPRPSLKDFPYRGLIKCAECGASITAEEHYKKQKNGKVHHYVYYHCTKKINPQCTQKVINVISLETQIVNFFTGCHVPDWLHQWACEAVDKKLDEMFDSDNSLESDLQKEITKLQTDKDRLFRMRMDDEITKEEYQQRKNEMDNEILILEERKTKLIKPKSVCMEKLHRYPDFIKTSIEEFRNGDPTKKTDILGALGYNHLLKDKILDIQRNNFASVMKDGKLIAQTLLEGLEPINSVAPQRSFNEIAQQSKLMWTLADSNR